MGLLDRLFGRRRSDDRYGYQQYDSPQPGSGGAPQPATDDQRAIERYRYLLRTAPPDAIEQAHAEAFAQLTPDQRRQVLGQLANNVPEYERVRDDDPRTLARMATRAEMRQPGFLERTFGGYGPGYGRGYGPGYGGGMMGGGFGMGGMGMGMGGMLAGGLLASIAGSFIGTAIAEEMFDHDEYMASGFADGGDGGDAGDGSNIDFDNSQVDASGVDDRTAGDFGSGDYGSGDGGDYGPGGDGGGGGGDAFGDFGDGGGADFGDFGGGDFGGGNDW